MSALRDVQLTAFPDIAPPRPVGLEIPSVIAGTNADLVAKVAPLYLTGSVLDVTYGKGSWWNRYRPEGLVAHDLDPTKGDGVSFLDLPEADRSVDTVTFDPPYIPQGGVKSGGAATFRDRYGLEPMNRAELVALIRGGMSECCRVARRFVLAKAGDYSNGRQFFLGHLDFIEAATESGWYVHDLIVHSGRPGIGSGREEQRRARRAHSYLIVFRPSKWDR